MAYQVTNSEKSEPLRGLYTSINFKYSKIVINYLKIQIWNYKMPSWIIIYIQCSKNNTLEEGKTETFFVVVNLTLNNFNAFMKSVNEKGTCNKFIWIINFCSCLRLFKWKAKNFSKELVWTKNKIMTNTDNLHCT